MQHLIVNIHNISSSVLSFKTEEKQIPPLNMLKSQSEFTFFLQHVLFETRSEMVKYIQQCLSPNTVKGFHMANSGLYVLDLSSIFMKADFSFIIDFFDFNSCVFFGKRGVVFINFNISLHSIILMSHFFAFFMIDDEPVDFKAFCNIKALRFAMPKF